MILRWSSSHARSHSSAPIKTTQMLLPSYRKNTPSFALCFCVCVVEKTSSRAVSTSATNEDPFQSLSLITSTFFPERKANVLGFY